MTNLESILKSRDIALPIKVCLVKAMVFPVVLYGCESWTVKEIQWIISIQFNSVPQSCLTLCDRMHCSRLGFPFPHQLPELTQTHVHRVGNAIQPSHPPSSPSPILDLAQHEELSK